MTTSVLPELSELLSRSLEASALTAPSSSVLIADMLQSTHAANFLLPYYMGQSLKPISPMPLQKVIFVAADGTAEHYATVSRKLGISFVEAHAKRNFAFLNVLAAPFQWTDEIETVENTFTSISQENIIKINTTLASPLRPLYSKLEALVEKLSSIPASSGVCIVVDALNSLAIATKSDQDIIDFAQYLIALTEKKPNSRLVVRAHLDALSPRLCTQLRYLFDLTIDVLPIKSGYSKEVDGELLFTESSAALLTQAKSVPPLPRLHFKLLENGVKFSIVHK